MYVDSIIEIFLVSEFFLEEICKKKKLYEDSVLRIIMKYCEEGWFGYEYLLINIVICFFW